MRLLLTSLLLSTAVFAGPAMAIVDDGRGCGCVLPCHIITR